MPAEVILVAPLQETELEELEELEEFPPGGLPGGLLELLLMITRPFFLKFL